MEVCEKIKNYGVVQLSNTELLEVLLGKSGKRKLNALLQQYDLKDVPINDDSTSNVLRIANLDFASLKHKGLSDLEVSRIMAGIELGIRICDAGRFESEHFVNASNPDEIAKYLIPRMRYCNTERFVCIALDAKNRIIGTKVISIGSVSATVVDAKQIFSFAILSNAVSIVVAHNHPSGVPEPSVEDITLTHILYSSGVVLNCPVRDHIIIGDGEYYSFLKQGNLVPNINI